MLKIPFGDKFWLKKVVLRQKRDFDPYGISIFLFLSHDMNWALCNWKLAKQILTEVLKTKIVNKKYGNVMQKYRILETFNPPAPTPKNLIQKLFSPQEFRLYRLSLFLNTHLFLKLFNPA